MWRIIVGFPCNCGSRSGQDHVGGFFADHDRGGVGVGGNDGRHDRGIDNAQARRCPLKRSSGVDHGLRVRAHPAGAGGVVVGLGVSAGVGDIVLIVRTSGPGRRSARTNGFQGGLAHDLLREFQALDRHFAVVGVCPVVRIDQRGGCRIG